MSSRWILLALCLCLGLTGCFGPRARFQSAEENDPRESDVRTIGSVCTVASQDEVQVLGVGLVVQLNGTGGGAPPTGSYRDMLEHELKKKGVRNVKTLLESPNCAMVIVMARIPPGARKNDPIDIEVNLPELSRCSSLRGGYLTACELFNFESSRNLNANLKGPEQLLKGHPLVKAEGPVITGLTGKVRVADEDEGKGGYRNEDESLKAGRVWGGGKCQIDPPLMLVLNPNQQYSRVAAQVADRINQTFPGMMHGRDGLASAKNKSLVVTGVPLQYRHDIAHFLRVLLAIPLDRTPPADGPYRRRLAEQLLDPVQCQSAAIRLEALGEDSVPLLRQALAAQLPLSRFAAAQALTYLRKRDGVEELARLARQQPALRARCLSALASLDESICHSRLVDLLSVPEPDLRYGAFCALRRLDDRAPEIAGEKCKDAYNLHQVAAESEPMVHYLTGRRAEIVLFGRVPQLLPEVRLMVGEDFTIATGADGQVTLKRFSLKDKSVGQKQCGPQLAEVLKTLAEMGGSYTDAIDLLNKAQAHQKLSCDLCHDALPRIIEPSQLARQAKDDPTLRAANLSASGR